jgi:hypothetical protein
MAYPVDNAGGAAQPQMSDAEKAVVDEMMKDIFVSNLLMQQSMIMNGIKKSFAKVKEAITE